AAGRKAHHGGRQSDVPPQGPDFDHQLVALLEESHFALGGEGEREPHLVVPVLLAEGVRCFGARDCGRILFLRVECAPEFLQPLASQHFVCEQRNLLHRHRREVGFDLLHDPRLQPPPPSAPPTTATPGTTYPYPPAAERGLRLRHPPPDHAVKSRRMRVASREAPCARGWSPGGRW